MKPPKLLPGDLVAVISPSGTIAHRPEDIKNACHNFEQATGLKTVLAPNALAQNYYSAGTAEQRVEDFHWALKNPDVKVIMFSVGGYTAIELVGKLDYELIKQNPKIIAGISDATTLLNAITAKTGLVTFLGIEFLDFAEEPMKYEIAAIKKAWFDGAVGRIEPNPDWHDFDNLPTSYTGWKTIRPGSAEGQAVGGNYASYDQLFHTEFMPSIEGNILFAEFYKVPKRGIHQSLAQLRLWGAFDKISGLIIGYCLGSDDPGVTGNERDLVELVLEATAGYNFPIMQVGEVGHNVDNTLVPIGAKIKFDAGSKTLEVIDTVTE